MLHVHFISEVEQAMESRQLSTTGVGATPMSVGTISTTVPQNTMPYTCQPCAKRKVKCDKIYPVCSTCEKGKSECTWQAPAPRRKRRRLSDNASMKEKMMKYENVLKQHGLLPVDLESPSTTAEGDNVNDQMRNRNLSSAISTPISESMRLMSAVFFADQDITKRDKLLTSGQGNAKYIGNNLWRDLGDEEMGEIYRDEEEENEEEHVADNTASATYEDPLTAAFMSIGTRCLLAYHPTHTEAMFLWQTHIENVEPLCRILHIPTVSQTVSSISRSPSTATRSDECLLFSIYHFAVFSMTDTDCHSHLHCARTTLLQNYSFAARQALLNASFLKTTSLTILQSLILFLMASRPTYDPHTFWIFTGVAVRIAQRIGLHRDGDGMDISPFEVEMRRRLFYQLLPLDGIASQMAGTGINIITEPTWNTKPASNLNDDQIWPEMDANQPPPVEKEGATGMIFCLARVCIGKYFSKTVVKFDLDPAALRNEDATAERMINDAEREVEEKYLRYCDIINPLHFLTLLSARSAITAMRLRVNLTKVKNNTISGAEQRELLQFAFKILDTDTAAYTNVSLKRYMWHIRPFFAWGTWDSLIFLLTSLRKGVIAEYDRGGNENGDAHGSSGEWMTGEERDQAWKRIQAMYENHCELLEAKRALQIAIGSLTIKAWDFSPPSPFIEKADVGEPMFIRTLRALRAAKRTKSKKRIEIMDTPEIDNAMSLRLDGDPSSFDPMPASDETNALFRDFPGLDFDLDMVDWSFWDQLMKEDQKQSA